MIRIAFIIGGMGKGGAERVISILANHYAEMGVKVDIIMLLNNERAYKLNDNVELHFIRGKFNNRIKNIYVWITGINGYYKKYKPEVVISFIARINIITILALRGTDAKLIVSERNDPAQDGRSKIVDIMTRILYPKTESVVFQTRRAQTYFPERVVRNSVIIPNPINVHVSAINTNAKKIVAVGRLEKQKNHALLIRAFQKVKKLYPDYKLYIYGDGSLRNNLNALITELNLIGAVTLCGIVNNVHERISDAKMFVLPSNYEGLSNALLEAMQMGIPCISTRCAGSDDLIVDQVNGILINIGDENGLVNAMCHIINSDDFCSQIGKLAKQSSEVFKSEEVLKKWDDLILRSR